MTAELVGSQSSDEDRIDINDINWTPEGAYVRFRSPRGRRVAFVPSDVMHATRSGRTSATAVVPIDGGPPLGGLAHVLTDELAYPSTARGRRTAPSVPPAPAPPARRPRRRGVWAVGLAAVLVSATWVLGTGMLVAILNA